MRLAHISDLHLSKISFHPSHLFSKRILGTCNLLLKRKRAFQQQYLDTLLPLFDSLHVNALLITGDLSSTSLNEEFLLAHDFLEQVRIRNISIYLLPGNHDMYTKKAFAEKSFYQSFQNFSDFATLPNEGIVSVSLDTQWKLVLVDCAKATSFFSSRGHFSKEIEEKLSLLLSSLQNHFVLIALHFPLSDKVSARKRLEKSGALKNILQKYPNVKIYLHGHMHKPSLEDLRSAHLPIIMGAGSVTWKQKPSFNLLDLTDTSCNYSLFQWHTSQWKIETTTSFQFCKRALT